MEAVENYLLFKINWHTRNNITTTGFDILKKQPKRAEKFAIFWP